MAGPPKLSEPATIICGSPIGRSTPFPIPKSTGLSDAAGKVLPSCAVWPNRASFSSAVAKGVRLVHRHGALPDAALLAEPGDARSLRGRLGLLDLLPTHEHLDAVARAGVVPKIDRPGVLVDEGGGGADEPRRAVGVEIVRARDQRNEPQRSAGSVTAARCASLGTRLFRSSPCRCRKALVRREEKRAAADDGTTEARLRTGFA